MLQIFFMHLRQTAKGPNVEPESWLITDICTELREALEKLVASQAIKIDTDSEYLVVVEPDVLEEPESEVVSELVPL